MGFIKFIVEIGYNFEVVFVVKLFKVVWVDVGCVVVFFIWIFVYLREVECVVVLWN